MSTDIAPDAPSGGCDRNRFQCKVLEVTGDKKNYANGNYKPAKTGSFGTRYTNIKRERFMIALNKSNKFVLLLINKKKYGYKILTAGKPGLEDPLTFNQTHLIATRASCEPWNASWKGTFSVKCVRFFGSKWRKDM